MVTKIFSPPEKGITTIKICPFCKEFYPTFETDKDTHSCSKCYSRLLDIKRMINTGYPKSYIKRRMEELNSGDSHEK